MYLNIIFLIRCQNQILRMVFCSDFFEVDNFHHMLGHQPHTHHHHLSSDSPHNILAHHHLKHCHTSHVLLPLCTMTLCLSHKSTTDISNQTPQTISSEVSVCTVFACQMQKVMISSWTHRRKSKFLSLWKNTIFWRNISVPSNGELAHS